MIQSCCHSCSQVSVAAAQKNVSNHFFLKLCVLTITRSACLFVLFHRNAAALILSFLQPSSLLTQWAGLPALHKWRVYGLLHAAYMLVMFHYTYCKIIVQAMAHMSLPTGARCFKFARSVVQRSQLVMVDLTQIQLSAHYVWFAHGGSHIT